MGLANHSAVLILGFAIQTAAADEGPTAAMQQSIEDIRQRYSVSAAAVILVEKKGTEQAIYSGVHDWNHARPVNADSYFRVGSVTKAFTGLALLKAEQEGLLRLDQTLDELLKNPPLDNPFRQSNPVTLAQLMEHTAGWFDMSRLEFDFNDPVTLPKALALNPASRKSHWPPGWHSSYSNSGPGVASHVVETLAKQAFDEFIQQQVFTPLAMDSATLRQEPRVQDSLVTGYNTDGKTPIPYWHIVYRASGGMNLKPNQMARYLELMLHRGLLDGERLYTEEQIQRLENPATTLAAKAGLEFGYGLGVYHYLHRGHRLHGHGGDGDGYLAHFGYSTESGRGFFVVINAFNHKPLKAIRRLAENWVIDGLPPPSSPAVVSLPAEVLQRYAGVYQQATTRFPQPGWEQQTLQVRVHEGVLQTRLKGRRWRRLLPLSQQHFRRADESVATAAFIPLADGRMVLQGRMGNYIRRQIRLEDKQ